MENKPSILFSPSFSRRCNHRDLHCLLSLRLVLLLLESCVNPSRQDPNTSDSEKCGLYVDENPPRLVSLGRVYEGSTIIYNIPLGNDQVKVDVEEVRNVDARIPISTQEVQLVGQTLNTFLAWATHLVKHLSEYDKQKTEGPAKLVDRLDPDVSWDATVFGVYNDNFPWYIKHGDLSEIACGGQCLSISIIQLWILQVCKQGMPLCMDFSSHSPYRDLDNHNLNQKIILRIECRIHRGIALKGFDDSQQSKSKRIARWIVVKCNKQKGNTECEYYYFTDPRLLEAARMKTIHIHWTRYYLKV
ncbi:hypothetical protein GmHk_04G010897 [Glycine max]|nr:hypothetical protein GmHk_04G010897 [Glycine max]